MNEKIATQTKEKLLNTPIHRAQRLIWVRKHHFKLNNPYVCVAHLEKLFYTTKRRRKVKKLPLGNYEKVGDENGIMPKKLSRRFPVKEMSMIFVGRPLPHPNFDGKILLQHPKL